MFNYFVCALIWSVFILIQFNYQIINNFDLALCMHQNSFVAILVLILLYYFFW